MPCPRKVSTTARQYRLINPCDKDRMFESVFVLSALEVSVGSGAVQIVSLEELSASSICQSIYHNQILSLQTKRNPKGGTGILTLINYPNSVEFLQLFVQFKEDTGNTDNIILPGCADCVASPFGDSFCKHTKKGIAWSRSSTDATLMRPVSMKLASLFAISRDLK